MTCPGSFSVSLDCQLVRGGREQRAAAHDEGRLTRFCNPLPPSYGTPPTGGSAANTDKRKDPGQNSRGQSKERTDFDLGKVG